MNTGLPRHLTVIDRRHVHFDRGERQRGLVGIHLVDQRPGNQRGADDADGARGDVEKVTAGRFRLVPVQGGADGGFSRQDSS
jgi:hypothetical protein